jgi:hypothetical protein
MLHHFAPVSSVFESLCGVEFGCIAIIQMVLAPSIFMAK